MQVELLENGTVSARFSSMYEFKKFISEEKEVDIKNVKTQATPFTQSKGTDLTQQVTDLLVKFGVPRHIKGFGYLREAIILSVNDKSVIEAMTKRLYPGLAKENDTTPSRVERAIRHGIEVGWLHADLEFINSVFGSSSANKAKPTNGEFIATLADNIRLSRQ